MANILSHLSLDTKVEAGLFAFALTIALGQLAFVKKSSPIEWLRDFTMLLALPLLTGEILARTLNLIARIVADILGPIAVIMACANAWLSWRCRQLKGIAPSPPSTDPDAWPPAPQSTSSTDR